MSDVRNTTAAILQSRSVSEFRILQLTDFHSDVAEYLNERTREDIRVLVKACDPDLLAVTGDIWCSDEHPDAAPMWMQRDIAFLGSLGVPWAFTWGNHDYIGDFQEAQEKIAAAPNSVTQIGEASGHYRLEVIPGEDAAPAWDLFFINTGTAWSLPGNLDWFRAETARLHEMQGRHVPAICFFHIPTRNYQEAKDEGRIQGIAKEEVLFWGDESGEAEVILKAAGNLRACFCGHSHKNDFSFKEGGVIFAYGRATGYGGYGSEDLEKGATLITLDLSSDQLRFETLLASDYREKEEK